MGRQSTKRYCYVCLEKMTSSYYADMRHIYGYNCVNMHCPIQYEIVATNNRPNRYALFRDKYYERHCWDWLFCDYITEGSIEDVRKWITKKAKR